MRSLEQRCAARAPIPNGEPGVIDDRDELTAHVPHEHARITEVRI